MQYRLSLYTRSCGLSFEVASCSTSLPGLVLPRRVSIGRVEIMCSLPIAGNERVFVKCRKDTVDHTPVYNTPMDLFIRRAIGIMKANAHESGEPFHKVAERRT